MSIFVGIGFLYAYKYTKSLLHSKYFQKLKNKIWPKSDYLDFNIFFTSYKLPSVHVYDENLKFEIQNTNCCLSEVIENTITGKSPDLLTIIKPKTGLKYGILYNELTNALKSLPKFGFYCVKQTDNNISFFCNKTEYKIATLNSAKQLKDSRITTTGVPNFGTLPGTISLDVPRKISNVEYKKFGQMYDYPLLRQYPSFL